MFFRLRIERELSQEKIADASILKDDDEYNNVNNMASASTCLVLVTGISPLTNALSFNSSNY